MRTRVMFVGWALSLALAFFLGRHVWPQERTGHAALDGSSSSSGANSAEARSRGPAGRDRGRGRGGGRSADWEEQLRAHAVAGQPNDVLVARMREVLDDPSPITRLPAWLRLLDSARAEDMPALLAMIEEARSAGRYDVAESEALWARWGTLDGPGALSFLAERKELRVGKDHFRAAQGWASHAPLAALEWIESQPADESRAAMLKGAMKGWAEKDLDSATSQMLGAPEGSLVRSKENVDALAWTAFHNRGLAGTSRWFRDLVNDSGADRDLKARGLSILLRELPNVADAEASAAFVREHLGTEYLEPAQVQRVVGSMRRNPERGIGFVDALGGEWIQENSAVIAPLVSSWMERDAKGPGQWLLENPNAAAYDQVAADYAVSIRSIDPEGADKWCESIKDPDLRQRTLGRIGAAASP